MRDLQELYDAVDLAVGAGWGVLPEDRLAAAAGAMRDLRSRKGHLGDTLVVAIAGGTGSGKSSLLNAVAGETVASTSRIRPHTDRPLAWVPRGADAGIDFLLDELGVEGDARHRQKVLPGVALIDLPDMDSTEEGHRTLVEGVLPGVDALLWVLDPEKYRDPGLHESFLRPLARCAEQTTFVLNKTDLIPGDQVGEVVGDATRALEHSGYLSPRLFPTAADPGKGPPYGIEPVLRFFGEEIDAKRIAQGKLLADIAGVLRRMGTDAGVWNGASVRFEERWLRARETAAAALDPAAGGPAEDALCRLEDLMAAIATELDPSSARLVRQAGSPEQVRRAAEAAGESAHGGNSVATVLDHELARPVADILRRRARFAGAVTYAAIGARMLAHRRGMAS